MQISRLFEIVYILLNKRQVTAKVLAERFEVSVRTIYRDIDALSQAGVPVYATQGAGGGISISDRFVLNKSALTDEEQAQILLALQSLSVTGTEGPDRLLGRLGSLFDKNAADWIEVDFSRWESDNDKKVLALIKRSILERHPLAFTYYRGDGIRMLRSADPVKLLYKSRAWYMLAYCHERQAFRTFKVVRMADIVMQEEIFERRALPVPPPMEVEEPFVPPPDLEPVVLRFQPQITWRVLDEFNPDLIHWEKDGTLTLRVYFPMDEWLMGYLLSFGDALEVLSPVSLRERLKEKLAALMAKYDT